MIKSCLKQIEPVDDEIVELDIKIKKGVLQNPEASGFWGMTAKNKIMKLKSPPSLGLRYQWH